MSPENNSVLIRNAAIAAAVGIIAGGAAGLWSLREPAAPVSIAAPAPAAVRAPTRAPVPGSAVRFEAANAPTPVGIAGTSLPRAQSLAPVPQPAQRRSGTPERRANDPVTPRLEPPTAPAVKLAAVEAQPAAAAKDDGDVLERARALARQPDVPALVALREGVVRRATENGLASSPAVKAELAELDRRLDEARLLRLKLDAEEFRTAKRPR